MNTAAFVIISVFTLSAALAAATLPNLMHAALCFVLALLGLASFFFLLGAEFVGLVLVFIYVGAVAVLIVFTILLTRRGSREPRGFNPPTPKATAGRGRGGGVSPVGGVWCFCWGGFANPPLSLFPPPPPR